MNFNNVAIHRFVAVADASLSTTTQQLEHGRHLSSACLGTNDQWVTPQSTLDFSAFALRRDRLYRYHLSPPQLTTGPRSATSIPEWGQPCSAGDPDHFRLQDLQEFESTDFQALQVHPRNITAEPFRHVKRMHDDGSGTSKPAKRPRPEPSSILGLIPQPHFIPSPAPNFRPVDTSKIPPFQKTLPSPVAPYDADTINLLLNSRFRRVAWLIPVRGSLPWDGASMAAVVEETHVPRSPSPCLHVPATQLRAITWTPNSLYHLWTFLGSIQRAKHLGPLSLSFHAASADALSMRDSISEPVWESNLPYYYQHSSKCTAASSADFATDICRTHLEGIDYIKVFHDVPYSLSLRNILDAYRYEPADGEVPGRSGANDRKIRILKGARLALMDESSKAAFLM